LDGAGWCGRGQGGCQGGCRVECGCAGGDACSSRRAASSAGTRWGGVGTAGDVTMRYGEVRRQELLRTSDEVVVTATRVALTVSRPSRSGHGEPEVGQQR